MVERPKAHTSLAQKELDKAEKQFDAFDAQVKEMTLDRMSTAPLKETEPQTKLSQSEIDKSKEIYLKPKRSIASREKFDEAFRKEYEYSMEFVRFIAENKEIIGETITLWTKPFPGMPAQEWDIPPGKPVWGPRHLAERISSCKYHRLIMNNTTNTGADGMGQYYGSMAVDTTLQRLDAVPVSTTRSVFMGARSF